MVTKLIKRLASRVLQDELRFLRNALEDEIAAGNESERRRAHAFGLYNKNRKQMQDLKGYCEWMADKVDGGETQQRFLFMRDMLDHGPEGPAANSHGVHPADRWNITSWFNYQRSIREDEEAWDEL